VRISITDKVGVVVAAGKKCRLRKCNDQLNRCNGREDGEIFPEAVGSQSSIEARPDLRHCDDKMRRSRN
jgi:hypothetical protein